MGPTRVSPKPLFEPERVHKSPTTPLEEVWWENSCRCRHQSYIRLVECASPLTHDGGLCSWSTDVASNPAGEAESHFSTELRAYTVLRTHLGAFSAILLLFEPQAIMLIEYHLSAILVTMMPDTFPDGAADGAVKAMTFIIPKWHVWDDGADEPTSPTLPEATVAPAAPVIAARPEGAAQQQMLNPLPSPAVASAIAVSVVTNNQAPALADAPPQIPPHHAQRSDSHTQSHSNLEQQIRTREGRRCRQSLATHFAWSATVSYTHLTLPTILLV
eukprot:403233-Amphidinium_carterae.1